MIVDTLILKMNIIRMKIFGLEECLWMGFPETDGRSNFIFSCFLKKQNVLIHIWNLLLLDIKCLLLMLKRSYL